MTDSATESEQPGRAKLLSYVLREAPLDGAHLPGDSIAHYMGHTDSSCASVGLNGNSRSRSVPGRNCPEKDAALQVPRGTHLTGGC